MTTGKYEDIIHIPHEQSKTRSHMSLYDRAVQFSPFAALAGHDAAIRETARLTNKRIEIDEDSKAALNEHLQMILESIVSRPAVTFTYFLLNGKKAGGAYVDVMGAVKK